MLNYNYKITSVDTDNKVMEVVYTNEKHGSLTVGVRLPYVNEKLEDIIETFSPVAYWLSLETPVLVPSVGTSGVIKKQETTETVEVNEVTL